MSSRDEQINYERSIILLCSYKTILGLIGFTKRENWGPFLMVKTTARQFEPNLIKMPLSTTGTKKNWRSEWFRNITSISKGTRVCNKSSNAPGQVKSNSLSVIHLIVKRSVRKILYNEIIGDIVENGASCHKGYLRNTSVLLQYFIMLVSNIK